MTRSRSAAPPGDQLRVEVRPDAKGADEVRWRDPSLAALLEQGGVACEVVTGSSDREAQIERFESGGCRVILGVAVLAGGTGYSSAMLLDQVGGTGAVYRVTGVDDTHDMRWTEYAISLLLFSAVSMLVLYAMQTAPLSHVAPAREVSMLFAALLGGHLLEEALRAGAVPVQE